jgi:microcystin-dependent protein
MASPFIGEIRSVGFNFAPQGWAFCAGQIMPISQNSALFALIGTIYGGDGQSTFGLPNLRGRVPVGTGNDGFGNTYAIGQTGGADEVTMTVGQLPAHNHMANCTDNAGTQAGPAGSIWATDGSGATAEYDSPTGQAMNAAAIQPAGGSTPHENRQPLLAINFVIALVGIFPTQN